MWNQNPKPSESLSGLWYQHELSWKLQNPLGGVSWRRADNPPPWSPSRFFKQRSWSRFIAPDLFNMILSPCRGDIYSDRSTSPVGRKLTLLLLSSPPLLLSQVMVTLSSLHMLSSPPSPPILTFIYRPGLLSSCKCARRSSSRLRGPFGPWGVSLCSRRLRVRRSALVFHPAVLYYLFLRKTVFHVSKLIHEGIKDTCYFWVEQVKCQCYFIRHYY